MIEWTDSDGQRVVVNEGRISVYGRPSMTSDTGQVAIGADVPAEILLRKRDRPDEGGRRGGEPGSAGRSPEPTR